MGGIANICKEYATKRYFSNLVNWGMLPFTAQKTDFKVGDYLYIEGIAEGIARGETRYLAKVISKGAVRDAVLELAPLTEDEKEILLAGCLINFNKKKLV